MIGSGHRRATTAFRKDFLFRSERHHLLYAILSDGKSYSNNYPWFVVVFFARLFVCLFVVCGNGMCWFILQFLSVCEQMKCRAATSCLPG